MSVARFGERDIGVDRPVYLIAELSGNHNQELARAEQLVKAAAQAGADAIKLQTYTPDTLTIDCDASWFRVGGGTAWDGRTLYELYGEAFTPWEWHEPLRDLALSLGLDWLSTPFDATAVDFLEELEVPFYKIASFEIVDLPLVERIAACGKPVILSTGMASLAEIDEAVSVLRRGGVDDLVLLKCTSAYPAAASSMHLRTIPHLAAAFGVPAGLSDHTLGTEVAVAAVTLGACVIEKHLTLRRADGGPDSSFSLEPDEFAQLAAAVRTTEQALGEICYGTQPHEESSRVFRRSLFVVEDVSAGELLTERNVRSIRPGYGLPPKFLSVVIGRRVNVALRRGTPLEWGHLAE